MEGERCSIPSQRVQAHEEECRQEFTVLVVTAKDVNDSPSVEWDEHLTYRQTDIIIHIRQANRHQTNIFVLMY